MTALFQLFANNAATTLASNVLSTDVTINLTSATGFPTITSSGQYFYMTLTDNVSNWEIVQVTATSGTVFTCVRGQDNTTALGWTSGAAIGMFPVAQGLRDIVSNSGFSNVVEVGQTAHGFSVGQVLYYTGSYYALNEANTITPNITAGIVSAVIDSNNFTLLLDGYISGLSGLTPGVMYYLSDTTAGALVNTPPTATTSVTIPILLAITTTSAFVNIARDCAPVDNPKFQGNITVPNGVILPSGIPSVTTNAIYNNAGVLYFNGASVGSGGGATTSFALAMAMVLG